MTMSCHILDYIIRVDLKDESAFLLDIDEKTGLSEIVDNFQMCSQDVCISYVTYWLGY